MNATMYATAAEAWAAMKQHLAGAREAKRWAIALELKEAGPMSNGGDTLSAEDIARRLVENVRTIHEWARSGKLTGAFKLGRRWKMARPDLEAYVAMQKERKPAPKARPARPVKVEIRRAKEAP